MARRNFTDKVRTERYEFAGMRCEGLIFETGQRCNADIRFKPWECDHVIPDRAGGKPTFDNARCLCKACHTAKYPTDRKIIDKVKANEARHNGVTRQKPKQKIPSPPSAKSQRVSRAPANGQSELARRYGL